MKHVFLQVKIHMIGFKENKYYIFSRDVVIYKLCVFYSQNIDDISK